jgi:hypothetical protein
MRNLQSASYFLRKFFMARIDPSAARISISRPGHHYLHMSNTSTYAGFSLQKKQARSSE